jgi:hypothetical protein
MEWVKKNYDIALLALATLFLVASDGFLIWSASAAQASSVAAAEAARPRTADTLPKPALEALKQADTLADKPSTLHRGDSKRGAFLVSRPYLLKEDKLIDPIEGKEKLHPPVENDWLITNGLDYSDLTILTQDTDNDGFTNLEEYEAKTNPSDAKDTPPSLNKLKLVKFDPKPFRLQFKGDPSGEGTEFQINLKDLKGSLRTQYMSLGSMIEGTPYKIVKYVKKESPNAQGVVVNVSELHIENTATGESLTLVYNKETNDPTSFGTFRDLLTGEEVTLKKGEEFTLKPNTALKLKLVDISATTAQIQDVSTGQIYRVLQLDSPDP